MSSFAAYICKLRDHINQNHLYYLKSILSSGALDGTPRTTEQYLHGGQKGEARVVPGLSGPATVEDLGGRVSLDLWAGPKKKNVPSQGEPHHVGLEPPRSAWALQACTARSHRSELGHHAAGFGVSLGKDN